MWNIKQIIRDFYPSRYPCVQYCLFFFNKQEQVKFWLGSFVLSFFASTYGATVLALDENVTRLPVFNFLAS